MSLANKNGFEDFFQEIVLEKPADKIIKQIKTLISSGQLNPGDRLPSERKLGEMFGVGRSHVREALRKLEFYGILRTLPQSGTVVAGLGVKALEGLISDVLQIEATDFHSLVETRLILEINAARLAAERATPEDIQNICSALQEFSEKAKMGEEAVEEDLMFHLKIAEASKNSVLKSLTLIIIPDMITYSRNLNICGDGKSLEALNEHQKVFDCIQNGDSDGAALAMQEHLQDMLEQGYPKM